MWVLCLDRPYQPPPDTQMDSASSPMSWSSLTTKDKQQQVYSKGFRKNMFNSFQRLASGSRYQFILISMLPTKLMIMKLRSQVIINIVCCSSQLILVIDYHIIL